MSRLTIGCVVLLAGTTLVATPARAWQNLRPTTPLPLHDDEFNDDLKRAVADCIAESAVGACACAAGCGNSAAGRTSFTGAIGTWDVSRATSMAGLFADIGTPLRSTFNTDISAWNVSGVRDMRCMFAASGCISGMSSTNLAPGMRTWDEQAVLSSPVPSKCHFNQDISSWDVSSVGKFTCSASDHAGDAAGLATCQSTGNGSRGGSFEGMFYGCEDFNQDISSWNIASSANLDRMFDGAKSFNQDISSWNMYKVTSAVGMFVGASAFDKDISSWSDCALQASTRVLQPPVGAVYNYGGRGMFINATAFQTKFTCDDADHGPAATCSTTSTARTTPCRKNQYGDVLYPYQITTLPVASQSMTSSKTELFFRAKCWKLTATVTTSGRTLKLTVGFTNRTEVGQTVTTLPSYTDSEYGYTYTGGAACAANGPFPASVYERCGITSAAPLVIQRDASTATEADFSVFGSPDFSAGYDPAAAPIDYTVSVESTTCTGGGGGGNPPPAAPTPPPATSVTSASLSAAVTACFAEDTAGNCQCSGSGCGVMSGPISSWSFTGTNLNMDSLFEAKTTFNQNIGSWDVSGATSMKKMFKNATSFNQPIGSWNTGAVTDTTEMFAGATSFARDISGWDVDQVTASTDMFDGATAFNVKYTCVGAKCTGDSKSSDDLSNGQIAGIAVGCVAFAAAVILVFACCRRRRRSDDDGSQKA